MTFAPKILLDVGGVILTVIIIMAISTVSVIGIKALYQRLNPTSATEGVPGTDYHVGDTIEDVPGFTSHVEEFTKHIGR